MKLKLKKDLPTIKAGTILKVDGNRIFAPDHLCVGYTEMLDKNIKDGWFEYLTPQYLYIEISNDTKAIYQFSFENNLICTRSNTSILKFILTEF